MAAHEAAGDNRPVQNRPVFCPVCGFQTRVALAKLPPKYLEGEGDNIAVKPFEVARLTDDLPLDVAFRYGDRLAEQMDEGMGLLFYGAHGLGKTHLACIVGLAAMRQGYDVLFTTFEDALNEVKSWYGRPESDAALVDPLLRFERCDLLLLDELGQSSNPTKNSLDRLFQLVNHRMNMNRPTIYTTNTRPELLRKRLAPHDEIVGAALVDRIVNMTQDFEVCASESYRETRKRRLLARLLADEE